MLTELSIRNVAIIDNLQIVFGPELNILSGETGAGKSIIIDALSLVCGSRASADLIRSGEDEATVEALFDLSGLDFLQQKLGDSGITIEHELVIRRCLSRSGRNRVYINGSMATLAQLSELGRQLVTIHGQHESQGLLRPDYHLELLDTFGGLTGLRREFTRVFEQLRQLEQRLKCFDEQERDTVRRVDLLAYQVDEITAAGLTAGEDEELQEQQRVLAHAERLAAVAGGAYEALYGGDPALLGDLQRVVAAVREVALLDHRLDPLHAILAEGYLQLEDVALQLRNYTARIESEPDRLRVIEDRLDQLQRLKRKYAPTIEEVIALGEQLQQELTQLRQQSCSRDQLQQEVTDCRRLVRQLGADLSERRKTAATELEQRLVTEVRELAIPHAIIQVQLAALQEPRATGCEKVEFLFSPNTGEPPRPLARVASGGELSRLMLAFKQVLPEGEAPTLVFDEVDTGVGGAVAGVIGRKLRHVAKGRQVFCVTHLPQVAAWASQHLRVEKRVLEGRTVTAVNQLAFDGQVQELARMLAGEQVTEAALQHAREMLTQVDGRA